MNTGAAGLSPVPGRLIPISACLLSPGPLTMQPMTATLSVSTPGIALLPDRHLGAQIALDAVREVLEIGAGGAPAARAGGDLRREGAQSQALQQLLADDHLLGARLAGPRRQRGPDGVADPLLEQDRERCAGRDDALGPDPGLGQAEMQGVAGAPASSR